MSFVMKPLNTFSTAFQIYASRIGFLQSDVCKLLQSYMSNFLDPKVLQTCNDITTDHFHDENNKLSDNKLTIDWILKQG